MGEMKEDTRKIHNTDKQSTDTQYLGMQEEIYETSKGNIHYWKNEFQDNRLTLLFLPGLTADHRLFEKQIETFRDKYNILAWDAPGHGSSRPFELSFSIEELAIYLHEIIKTEQIKYPVICGQSMGGYIGQGYMQKYQGMLTGFISIDSPPLQRKYMTAPEIWMLKHTEPLYRPYPWEALKRDGAKGCAETEYGIRLMKEMMKEYTKEDYITLTCYGFKIVGFAVEADLPYEIDCPALIMCGEQDKAGSTKRYIKNLSKKDHVPVQWIPGAGHNSNSDNPELVNKLIQEFLDSIKLDNISVG